MNLFNVYKFKTHYENKKVKKNKKIKIKNND